MTVIADSSFVYSLFNQNETQHDAAAHFASTNDEVFVIPDVILPEVSYLFRRDFGHRSVQIFLSHLQIIDAIYEPIIRADLPRMLEIAETYADAEFDIVDCCIMAIAERLDINRIATFDHRDFGIFRPEHCEFLELLP